MINSILYILSYRIVVLFVITTWLHFGMAAQTFNISHGKSGNNSLEVTYSIEVFNDTIVAFFHRPDGPTTNYQVWKIKFDFNGNPLDSVAHALSDTTNYYNFGFNGINKTFNGGLVCSGDIIDGPPGGPFTYYGGATLLNHALDTVWARRIGEPSNLNEIFQARPCANGDFIFVGISDINNLNLDVLVARFDAQGNHLWTHNYSTLPGYEEWGWTIVETLEGDFIVGGYVQQNINQPNNRLLLKIDADGNLINYQIIGDYSLPIGWPKLEYCNDGNFIYCGSTYPSGIFDRDAYFCKIDSYFNIIWESQYPLAPELGYMSSIKENPDGSFISVGGGKKENGEDEGILVKLDAQGQLLWQRHYQHALDPFYVNYLYDVVATSDGGYVAGGGTLPVPQGQQIWLLKVDSMGCLVPGCDTLVSVFELDKNTAGFEIFPNPASENLNVYFEHVEPNPEGIFTVYDLQGRALHSFAATTSGVTYIVSVVDLPAGMYVLEYSDSRARVSKKWVRA